MSKKALMWICCGAMVLAGAYFLWSRGAQFSFGYVMLLLCPLMHLFMHRGHGHRHGSDTAGPENGSKKESEKPACH